MSETSALVEIERNGLSALVLMLAVAREVEAVTASDARLMAAAAPPGLELSSSLAEGERCST